MTESGDDIVARLEHLSTKMFQSGHWGCDLETIKDAMDTIVDLRVELERAREADLLGRLERVALMAEIANHYVDDMRVMPAAGVADVLYEALHEIKMHRGVEE